MGRFRPTNLSIGLRSRMRVTTSSESEQSIDEGLAALTPADWDSSPVGADFSAETLLNVAIEHRLMHAETLAYMLHQLPLDRKVARTAQA